jgi:hypothetical protein
MQVSWIDETDMSALLGSLRGPVKPATVQEELACDDTLWDEPETAVPAAPSVRPPEPAVTSTEAHADLHDFRARLQAIRNRALDAGLLSRVQEAAPDVEAEPFTPEAPAAETQLHEPVSSAWSTFQPSGSTVIERLASFVAWAQPHLIESEFYIIDDQGEVLWGQSHYRGLVLSTVMAWVATSRMSAVFAFERAPLLRKPMATGGHLLAIPCPTRLGLMHLAITTAHPLPDEPLPDLRQALIMAMEES